MKADGRFDPFCFVVDPVQITACHLPYDLLSRDHLHNFKSNECGSEMDGKNITYLAGTAFEVFSPPDPDIVDAVKSLFGADFRDEAGMIILLFHDKMV